MYPDHYEEDHEETRTYEFMTPKEVMEELAIGKNTLYAMLNNGSLPGFRIGKHWRVKRTDLLKWKP